MAILPCGWALTTPLLLLAERYAVSVVLSRLAGPALGRVVLAGLCLVPPVRYRTARIPVEDWHLCRLLGETTRKGCGALSAARVSDPRTCLTAMSIDVGRFRLSLPSPGGFGL